MKDTISSSSCGVTWKKRAARTPLERHYYLDTVDKVKTRPTANIAKLWLFASEGEEHPIMHYYSTSVLLLLGSISDRGNADASCSREHSRKVRGYLQKEILPRVHIDKLPDTCILHPSLDLYQEQEKKKEVRISTTLSPASPPTPLSSPSSHYTMPHSDDSTARVAMQILPEEVRQWVLSG